MLSDGLSGLCYALHGTQFRNCERNARASRVDGVALLAQTLLAYNALTAVHTVLELAGMPPIRPLVRRPLLLTPLLLTLAERHTRAETPSNTHLALRAVSGRVGQTCQLVELVSAVAMLRLGRPVQGGVWLGWSALAELKRHELLPRPVESGRLHLLEGLKYGLLAKNAYTLSQQIWSGQAIGSLGTVVETALDLIVFSLQAKHLKGHGKLLSDKELLSTQLERFSALFVYDLFAERTAMDRLSDGPIDSEHLRLCRDHLHPNQADAKQTELHAALAEKRREIFSRHLRILLSSRFANGLASWFVEPQQWQDRKLWNAVVGAHIGCPEQHQGAEIPLLLLAGMSGFGMMLARDTLSDYRKKIVPLLQQSLPPAPNCIPVPARGPALWQRRGSKPSDKEAILAGIKYGVVALATKKVTQ